MYRSQPIVKNPFAPLFIHLLGDHPPTGGKPTPATEISKQEKLFLYQLITSPALTRELLKKTPRQILSSDITNAPNIDVTGLQAALLEKQSDLPQISQTGISTILCDPDADSSGSINMQVAHQVIESMICSSVEPPLEDTFQPPHVHLAPPLHKADKGS